MCMWGLGTGIPDSSEEDACVAQELGVSWESVVKSEEDGSYTLINSSEVHTPQVHHVSNKPTTDIHSFQVPFTSQPEIFLKMTQLVTTCHECRCGS